MSVELCKRNAYASGNDEVLKGPEVNPRGIIRSPAPRCERFHNQFVSEVASDLCHSAKAA